MKTKILSILLVSIAILLTNCEKLDLNPLAQGSSDVWYSNADEIKMSINGLYQDEFWSKDNDLWTDDFLHRVNTTPITTAAINGEIDFVGTLWANSYKAIARANTILANLEKASDVIPEQTLDIYEANARFVRAYQYSILISHYGDVIYYTDILDLDESFSLSRTTKATILQAIYQDFDFAIEKLPVSYGSSELKYATKGAALALKTRIALYMEDWLIARDAAKACIELGSYKLYPDFRELFLSKTKNVNETIFSLPKSIEYNVLAVDFFGVADLVTRNAGGWGAVFPSWELFCAFPCTDGKPIDESPLFDPRNPFENRDPRCTATIVEFQTEHLGFMYQPHIDSIKVWNFSINAYVSNKDTRSVANSASYNGLVMKKFIDNSWLGTSWKVENEKIIIRYADVLLMYAEAKIELNEIDQSVLDAINNVRARAYKVKYDQTSSYPAVGTLNRDELRKIVRLERRIEFAHEGLRYMDIIRWKMAEKVLNRNIYGILDVAALQEKVIKKGLWFFPEIPPLDEDGIADFTSMYNAGLIKMIKVHHFDATRQYLWPIPSKEILINKNINQNSGY